MGCTCAGSLSKINLSASEGVWRSCTSCRAKGDGDMCSKCGAAVHTSYRLRVSLMDNTGTLDVRRLTVQAYSIAGLTLSRSCVSSESALQPCSAAWMSTCSWHLMTQLALRWSRGKGLQIEAE